MTDHPFEDVTFAEMLNTRFCHDMAGPVSAVNNGVEYLLETDNEEMRAQAIDLLKMSTKEALSKLQTYRMAYGRVNQASESSVEELREMIQRFFVHGKVELDWPESGEGSFDEKINNEVRRVLVNMITIVSALLVYGGTLSVRHEAGDKSGGKLIVSAEHERIKQADEVIDILKGSGDETLNPHNVPAWFLMRIAKLRNMNITMTTSDSKAELIAEYT